MKYLLSILSLLVFTYGAHAKVSAQPLVRDQYVISAKIYRGDFLLSSPRLALLEGEEAVVEQSSGDYVLRFSVLVEQIKSGAPGELRVSMKLYEKHDGKVFESNPQIAVMADSQETSIIEVGETDSLGKMIRSMRTEVGVESVHKLTD